MVGWTAIALGVDGSFFVAGAPGGGHPIEHAAVEALADGVVHGLLEADAAGRHPVSDHLLGVQSEIDRPSHTFTITAAPGNPEDSPCCVSGDIGHAFNGTFPGQRERRGLFGCEVQAGAVTLTP